MRPTTTFPNIIGWRPASAMWMELAEKNPHLGISPTLHAWNGFFRHYREVLVEAQIVIRLTSRTWLGDPTRFPSAVLAIKCGCPITHLAADDQHSAT